MELKDVIENKNNLLTTMNKQGHLLELQAKNIVSSKLNPSKVHLTSFAIPLVFDDKNGVRVEIDGSFITDNIHALYECKKNDSVWFFFKEKRRDSALNFLTWYREYVIRTATITKQSDISISSSYYEFAASKKNLKDGGTTENPNQTIHKAVYQLIKNLQEHLISDNNKPGSRVFLPILITNANLFLVDVDEERINKEGDLDTIENDEIHKVNYLAYNFPKTLYCFKDGKETIIDSPAQGTTSRYLSIFVVNIDYLAKFIEEIDQYVGVNRHNLIRA